MAGYDVFLSYGSEDRYFARLIRRYFHSHNLSAWIDEEHMRATERQNNEHLLSKIFPEIQKSRFLIALLSKRSFDKEWPRREVEEARRLQGEGHPIEIVFLFIDDIDVNQAQDLTKDDPYYFLDYERQTEDPLVKIRRSIGAEVPTYIHDLDDGAGFIKQIEFGEIGKHLRKSKSNSIKIWLLNGGHSFRSFLKDTLEKMCERAVPENVSCSVVFMSSTEFKSSWPERVSARGFQRKLEETIERSNIPVVAGDQKQLIERSVEDLRQVQAYCRRQEGFNFSYEVRLIDRIPAGRLFLAEDVGFFGPFVRSTNVDAPVFAFDADSEFYKKALRFFDDVFEVAELFEKSE
ncbi:MAG: toll/interleukin-1 receptor domain-containing protein [Rhodobacteraceae bacterium]|nr:toll/interleukin-1 receptor domain-containing protein [Paracoccaceae bacterium]